MKIVAFDFEVLPKIWTLVIKSVDNPNDKIIIVNDREALVKYYETHKHNTIFMGYNNKHYDNNIFKAILQNLDPYQLTRWIIEFRQPAYKFAELKYWLEPFYSLDLMDLDLQMISLKECQHNMGWSIVQSKVDFTIDRDLTEEELSLLLSYNENDVDSTILLYKAKADKVKTKLLMIIEFNLGWQNLIKTNAQLTAMILGAKKNPNIDVNQRYDAPKQLILNKPEYRAVLQQFLDADPSIGKIEIKFKYQGVNITCGYGGAHGAKPRFIYNKKKQDNLPQLWSKDVKSYYVNMMIIYNFVSRSITDTSRYANLNATREKLKAENDPREQSYKNCTVTAYGAHDQKFNALYDPYIRRQIAISGQLFLLDLLEKLEPYIELVQCNTDGVYYTTNNIKACEAIEREWEKRTGFFLEGKLIELMYQKDVNNYVLLDSSNNISVRGSNFRQVGNKMWEPYLRYTNRIVDIACVNYLCYNIPIEETICNPDVNLREYQVLAKGGTTYKGVVWEIDGKFVNILKINRVVATKNTRCGTLYKFKVLENGERVYHKIANLPEHCVVINNDISTYDKSKLELDLSYYVAAAYKRIKDTTGREYI